MKNPLQQSPLGLFTRYVYNPILSPGHWPYPVEAVVNPGVAVYRHETILLCRVVDRYGSSYLQVARSSDGVADWRIDPKPLISYNPGDPNEQWGVEDPRITWMEELKCWVIAYTVYGPKGPMVALATTEDFRTAKSLGPVLPPEDKDAALLPRRINGEYILIHRPINFALGRRADIRLSRSTNLKLWTESEPVLQSRLGVWWDSARVGLGPEPYETPDGWLMLYHGVKATVNGLVYRLGLALLDRHDPARVLHRSEEWIFGPEELYERVGNVPNIVFPCGWVVNPQMDEIRMYYGVADTAIGLATARLSQVMAYIKKCPQPQIENADAAAQRPAHRKR